MVLAFLVFSACLMGCNKPGQTGLLPGFNPAKLMGESLDAGLVANASIESFEGGTRRFGVIEEGHVESVIEMEVTAAGDGQWRTEIVGQRASLMRIEDGRLLLAETTDYPNNAVTTFDPPLPLVENGMSEGRGVKTQHQVVVHSLNDRSQVVDRGTAEQTLIRDADQDLLLPGGKKHRAAQLARTLDITLGRAKVHEETTSWYVPGLGLAAEQSKEVVKVFGPIGWTHERLWVRVPQE